MQIIYIRTCNAIVKLDKLVFQSKLSNNRSSSDKTFEIEDNIDCPEDRVSPREGGGCCRLLQVVVSVLKPLRQCTTDPKKAVHIDGQTEHGIMKPAVELRTTIYLQQKGNLTIYSIVHSSYFRVFRETCRICQRISCREETYLRICLISYFLQIVFFT